MINAVDVLKTIDNNPNLSLEIKENIKDLLTLYANNNDKVDLETLNTNLSDLKIESCNKYLIKEPLKYNDPDKTLYVNSSETDQDYDYRYLLMRELMLMQTYKKDTSKPRQDHLNPIYAGYASICANYFVGNDSPINLYEDEIITVNLLEKIVGMECIEELFVNNNGTLIIDNLFASGNTIDDIKSLTNLMNYNMSARDNARGKSMLNEVQLKLITMFTNKENKTAPEIENFKNYLYGNNEVFGDNNQKYQEINQIYEIYDEIANNILLNDSSISKVR